MPTHAMPKISPWGRVQHANAIGTNGLFTVSTSGHGGVKVPSAMNKLIHPVWRNEDGWYEEDCEWAIVVLTFPGEFAAWPRWKEHAPDTARGWFPDGYAAHTGTPVDVEDSFILQQRAAAEASKNGFVVRAAFGSGQTHGQRMVVPEGLVGVFAHQATTDSERWFLVPKEEYDTRGRFGFVVDLARHAAWPELVSA